MSDDCHWQSCWYKKDNLEKMVQNRHHQNNLNSTNRLAKNNYFRKFNIFDFFKGLQNTTFGL